MNSFHQQGPPQYEYIYGSVILDELHNYFPSLLYEQYNFNNIGDVFNYMNQQIAQRFNPFTYGRSRYLGQNHSSYAGATVATTPVRPTTRVPTIPIIPVIPTIDPAYRRATVAPTASPTAAPAATPAAPANSPPPLTRNSGILNQLLNRSLRDITYYYEIPQFNNTNTLAINSIFRQLLQEYESPVPIIPSDEDLAANTTIVRIDDITTPNSCTICQEDYVVGDTIRKINQCTHYFHKSCIDSWFLANARCPVCRHDIRNADAALTE